MPELSELENNDRIKVHWGKYGWKKATVINIEVSNDNSDDIIFTLEYENTNIRLIRDYLRLKWDFLAESPKYSKPPKKKEKKTFELGLTTGRKRNFPDYYVAEPTQLYQRKKRKETSKYNKASSFLAKYNNEDTRDNGINDLEFADSQVTSPLDDTHQSTLILDGIYVSSSLSPCSSSTSLFSEKKNLLVENKKEEVDKEEDDVEDEDQVVLEEKDDDEVEVEVEEEDDVEDEDEDEVDNVNPKPEIKEKSKEFDETFELNSLKQIQDCTKSILNCLNDLNIEAISSN